MIRNPAILMVVGALWIGVPATVGAADVHKIDLAHSSVIFRVKHLGIAPTFGWFRQFSGTFILDEQAPHRSSVSIVVDTASVYTGDKKRDQHLRSPDFFNAKQYPKITFKSTKVARSGKRWKIAGELEMHGTVQPVTLVMAQLGEGKDPWGNYRVGFEGSVELKRSRFGMTKMIGVAGDDVRVLLAVEGIKQ